MERLKHTRTMCVYRMKTLVALCSCTEDYGKLSGTWLERFVSIVLVVVVDHALLLHSALNFLYEILSAKLRDKISDRKPGFEGATLRPGLLLPPPDGTIFP